MDSRIDISAHRLEPDALELAQARLLYERAGSSAISVFGLLVCYCFILTFLNPLLPIILWFAIASLAILITLLLPYLFRHSGVTLENMGVYLGWHTAISCVTGAIWGIGAASLTDVHSETSLFLTGVLVLSISLGGIAPHSAYRRSYVGLATFVLLPYATWVLVMAPWPLSGTGIGIFLAYAFFMSASARVEIGTRDMLAIRQNAVLIEELSRQRNALQKANEEKTRFLAATSHDLAQPLHAQGFYLAALRERTTRPEQLTLLDKVESSWRGLGYLLDGLVDVSRLDAGVIVPDTRPIDVGTLVRRVCDEFAPIAAEHSVTLEIVPLEASVRTDPLLLTRILRNLMSNAIKFTAQGGSVTISVLQEEQNVIVKIEDTGCGIPPDKLDLVFDEYVQLDNSERDREKGLGLGLSIVRRLVKLLGLKLDMSSRVGEGTCATLTLEALQENAHLPQDERDTETPFTSIIGNLCILLVDNEDAIRSGMTTVLTSWGCQVYSARSSHDVLEVLAHTETTPHVLLVDHRLGDYESGLDIIETVRDEINETVPAIIMTGDIAGEDLEQRTVNLSVIHKPVEPERLHRILRRIAAGQAEVQSTDPVAFG
tara:strand:- start:328174 stop:329973 length:1800 start_codon:yes stop_codon:yes gene_type:complete